MPAQAMQFAYVYQLAGSAIWLRCVKLHNSLEIHGFRNQLGKFPDSEFFACAHINVAVAYLAK